MAAARVVAWWSVLVLVVVGTFWVWKDVGAPHWLALTMAILVAVFAPAVVRLR